MMFLEVMFEVFQQRNDPAKGASARLVRGVLAIGALTLAATACGGSRQPVAGATGGDASPITSTALATTPSTLEAVPPTTAPATIAPATTTPTTTQPTTSTSTAPTSTAPALPDTPPIAPPTDVYADEPVIEMGTLSIPKIGVAMTMYEGIRLTTLDYGPGHWPGSALPGEVGNVVVAGHRTSKHHVFRDVDQLVAGDEIIFRDATGEHVYRVDRVEIVQPSAIWIVDPTATPTATLFACHPPGSTTERIVVFADLVA
jgi:sortase A